MMDTFLLKTNDPFTMKILKKIISAFKLLEYRTEIAFNSVDYLDITIILKNNNI